jgi:hypothetical protein
MRDRDCPLGQDLPWGWRPLCVWKEDQSKGVARLLSLARRLVTLLASPGRRGWEQTPAPLAGLDEGQPTRTTERPTGLRILPAFARAQRTVTHGQRGTRTGWHLTPLAPWPAPLWRYVRVPTSLETALANNTSESMQIYAKVPSEAFFLVISAIYCQYRIEERKN